jgi:L-ribulose-5-phosphate 3-epimerase
MKKSICRGFFPREMAAPDVFVRACEAGFSGIQLIVQAGDGELHLGSSEAEVASLRRHAETHGLAIHSLLPSIGALIAEEESARRTAVANFRRALTICRWIGADVLLVHPGQLTPIATYDRAYEWLTLAFRELRPDAKREGVSLAVENVWNKFLLSPLEAAAFVDSFGSERIGFYFDTGNIIPYGFAEQWIRILGKRIKEIHVKDFRRSVGTGAGFVPLLAGDVNWPDVRQAMREVGYDGWLCAELGPYPTSAHKALRDISSSIDTIIAL